MLIHLLVSVFIVVGYNAGEACFNFGHVITFAPPVQEARQEIDQQFDRQIEHLQSLRSERAVVADFYNYPELGRHLATLDTKIAEERQQIQAELNTALEERRKRLEIRLKRELTELQRILDIGTLYKSCKNHPLLHDVTDAVLAHLRGLQVI